MGPRYSTTILNEPGKDGVQRQRTISLRDSKSNQIVAIGFEDNIDLDYCDAIFYVHIAEKDAIDEGVIPELPTDPEGPTDEDNYTSYSGILTFEDLWPEQGDYDMNDVMIRYTSKVYKSILTNRIYKVVDEFTPLHRGGYLVNGFVINCITLLIAILAKLLLKALRMRPNPNICPEKQRLVNHILQSCYLIIWQYLIIKKKKPGNTL